MYQMTSTLMSQMQDLIGFDNEKLSSHWGFSRRGMHIGVVDEKLSGIVRCGAATARLHDAKFINKSRKGGVNGVKNIISNTISAKIS